MREAKTFEESGFETQLEFDQHQEIKKWKRNCMKAGECSQGYLLHELNKKDAIIKVLRDGLELYKETPVDSKDGITHAMYGLMTLNKAKELESNSGGEHG